MSARIYKPARSAMQSGKSKDSWILEHVADAPRSADPLMGWTSSADTTTQVRLNFATRELAEAYAKSKGIPYTVTAESPVRMQKKSYSDNFKYGRTENWTH